jgi:pilin isopeptide linkage protein/LPXTG-motif cell wall-anchored protein
MPGDAAALEAFVNTADCTRSNGYMTTATFPETFVFTAPGTYEYEVAQQKGGSLNGTYDTRTMVLRVTVSWSDDTLVAVAKVYESGQSSNDKEDSILFHNTFNNSAPDDPYDPPYIPGDPYTPDPKPTPVVPTPETPVNPPVLDARPDTTTPTVTPAVPVAETPVNPPVADARAPKLIQTGQLNWPVPVLAGLGTLFLAAGVILLTKKKEDDNA